MNVKKKKQKYNKLQKIFDIRLAFYDFVKITGALPTIIYLRIKRFFLKPHHKPKLIKEPYIILSNHISYIDPVIISNLFWFRRVCFVTTDYFFKKKFLKILFTGFGCIPISKENVAVATFKKVKNNIDRGHCIGLFPEGGVERDNKIDKFKAGAVMMALICNVPLVIVYIKKRPHWWNRQQAIIGEKINVKDYLKTDYPTMEEIQEVASILHEKELELARILEEK